ncbi:MAG TPA: hypothetical protein VL588_00580, partial [Bdellovibrionota bacterium]|nr:hypothetical protein [Bdellovibrionota bacterium]
MMMDDEDESAGGGSDEFARMFEESVKSGSKGGRLSTGQRIKGEIILIGREDVFVSTGTQADGIVPKIELTGADGSFNHKVGDVLDLYVAQVRGGEVRLSTKLIAPKGKGFGSKI